MRARIQLGFGRDLRLGQATMQLTTTALGEHGCRKPAVWNALTSCARGLSLALCAGVLVLVTASCASRVPRLPESQAHVTQPPAAQPDNGIPPPARESAFVPPPKPAVKLPTYTVVVNEVPVKELLLALARDTKQNIDIHPGLDGKVSLNAINETLPGILDRLSKQVNLRYTRQGNTLIVSPDTPYMKTYVVNYVNIQRDTTSTSGASGQISSAGGAGSSGGSGNTSSTTVTTKSNSDFWGLLEKSVRSILNSSLQQRQKVEAIAESIVKKQEETRARQMEAASAASKPGAAAPPAGGAGGGTSGAIPVVVVAPEDVIVNAVAGTVTVNGDEKQHQMVQEYLTKVENGAQRQVLIEATIVEVALSDAYQGGIDWRRFASAAGGFDVQQSLLSTFGGGLTPSTNSLQILYTKPDTLIGQIAATIKLLDAFGSTRVLSSPKLMALNNQTALLKAVNNIVYFEVLTTPPVITATTVTPATTTTTAKTVSVGVVMSVTPQINEDGRVTLIVRPTISSLTGPGKQDPNPALIIPNFVPEIQIREMESVLQVGSGQTVILGGLMQDDVRRNRQAVPGISDVSSIGEFFKFRDERVTKSELVIFIRPVVVINPSLESDELKFYQRFLPQQSATPTTTTPGGKAGAAK